MCIRPKSVVKRTRRDNRPYRTILSFPNLSIRGTVIQMHDFLMFDLTWSESIGNALAITLCIGSLSTILWLVDLLPLGPLLVAISVPAAYAITGTLVITTCPRSRITPGIFFTVGVVVVFALVFIVSTTKFINGT
jgi:hypothetical protein